MRNLIIACILSLGLLQTAGAGILKTPVDRLPVCWADLTRDEEAALRALIERSAIAPDALPGMLSEGPTPMFHLAPEIMAFQQGFASRRELDFGVFVTVGECSDPEWALTELVAMKRRSLSGPPRPHLVPGTPSGESLPVDSAYIETAGEPARRPPVPRGTRLWFTKGPVVGSVSAGYHGALGATDQEPRVNPLYLVENIARAIIAKMEGRSFAITDKSLAEQEEIQRLHGPQVADFEAKWALPTDALLDFDFRARSSAINVRGSGIPLGREEKYLGAPASLFRHGHTAVTVEDGEIILRESFWYQETQWWGRNIFIEIRQGDNETIARNAMARWRGEIPRWYEAAEGTWSGSTALTTGGLAMPVDECFWQKSKDAQYEPFTTHYDLYFRVGTLAVHLGLEGLGDYRDEPWSRQRLWELMDKPSDKLTSQEEDLKDSLLYRARQGRRAFKWFWLGVEGLTHDRKYDPDLGPGGIVERQRHLLENIAMKILANHYGVAYTIGDGPAASLPSPLTSSKTSVPTGAAFLLACGSLLLWRRGGGLKRSAT